MTNYYIEKDNKIIFVDTDLQRLQNTIIGQDLIIKETERPIENFEFADTPEYIAEQVQERQAKFESNFFLIPDFGWYRKQPKGYSSAVESMNTAFNAVTVLGKLPADYLIFYTAPDFSDETQCTEEWLIANQVKNTVMTAAQFGQFYAAFITAWNTQEH